MSIKLGLFVFLLTVLQVSARYKSFQRDNNDILKAEYVAEPPPSSRITGGWEALPGQFPYHAALRFVRPSGHLRQCGGSIVSKEWVITAATCTVGQILAVVRAGVVYFTNPEYIFETTEWYRHPNFNSLTNALQPNDIALVKLQRPVMYTRLLQPIRVQSSADAYRDYNGEHVIASGHGISERSGPDDVSDVLRWVYLWAISNKECHRLHSTGVYDTTICAKYFNVTSQSTCSGDNGGPLVHRDSKGIPTLIGVAYFITSPLFDPCSRNLPSVFTRTGPYLPWFEEVTGIDFDNLQADGEDVDKPPLSTTTTPITNTTEPITSTTAPINSTTTPTTNTTNPITNTTTPVTNITKPTTTTPLPSFTTTPSNNTTEPITSTTSPINSTTTPTTNNTTPTTNTTTPITNTTEPTTTTSSPSFTTTPISNTTEPITSTTSATNSTIKPITTTTTPINSTTDPSTTEPSTVDLSTISTPEYCTSTPTPISSTTESITNTTAPITNTTEPITTEPSTTSSHTPPTDSEEQEPDGVTPDDDTTPPEETEDKEDEEEDSGSSESNEDDEIAQLLKRLLVDVKVKIRFDKYNVTNAQGNELIVAKH